MGRQRRGAGADGRQSGVWERRPSPSSVGGGGGGGRVVVEGSESGAAAQSESRERGGGRGWVLVGLGLRWLVGGCIGFVFIFISTL